MTEAEKIALAKKLGAASNKDFDSRYSVDNRKWFARKVIDSLLAKGVPDANVEQQTKDIIFDSGVALKARIKKGFSEGTLANKWGIYDKLTSRTQIIYGLLAMHPEFRDIANADYFDFIIERRFRSIQRMTFFVNPNKVRNVFAYPDPSTIPPQQMKVNNDSISFWDGALNSTLPFVLTAAGKSDPVNADENLFKKKVGIARNLLACDPVVTIMHMDALRAAKNPDTLLKALANVGDHYLKIDNPLGHFANYKEGQRLVGISSAAANAGSNVDIKVGRIGPILQFIQDRLTPAILTTDSFVTFQGPFFMIVQGVVRERFVIDKVNPVTRMIRIGTLTNSYTAGAKIYATRTLLPFYGTLPFHFISDSRPDQALFEQLSLTANDLQVGDHVFVLNHPLYKIFFPSGAWGGEHSFITEIGNRDSAASGFRTTLKLEGHGVDATSLLGMGTFMVELINIVLATLQAVTKIHLNNLKTNGRTTTANVTFIQRNEQGLAVNVFEYTVPYTYTVVAGGKKTSYTLTKGFVIKERSADPNSAFQLFNNDGTDSIVDATHPPPEAFVVAVFTGTGAAEQFKLSKWATPFFNPQTARFDAQPLFAADDKTPTALTFDDLAKSKPFFLTDDVGDAYVTRPRVDFSAGYQTFLRNIGAI
jgi:hypothetical protein